MKYQAYAEYKDSGVEWLGSIPSHWLIAPFKWQIERNDGGVWGNDPDGIDDTIVLRSTEQTVNGNWILDDPAPRKISAAEKSFSLLKSGDLLVTKSSGSSLHIGKTTLVSLEIEALECCYSNFMQRIRTKSSLMPKLAWYVMNNELARKQFDFLSNSTTGLANLNGTMIGQILFALPKWDEQKRIVEFLEHETAKIDTLIEKQQQLIQLLKEKRQAVISHAVTKGLNPDVPMRDSGVEWLGEVPEHWDKIRIKYVLLSLIDTEHKTAEYFDDGEYLVCRTTNVRNGELRLDGGKYTNYETYKQWTMRGQPEINDILFTREAPAGEACLVPEVPLLCLGQRMVLFKLNKSRMNAQFVLYSIYSGLADDFIKQLSQGSTVSHFNMADISNIPLIECPLKEQKEIVDYLDKKLAKYNVLQQSAERAIELMQERRTALISAAVTGKIDVRKWQPPKTITPEAA